MKRPGTLLLALLFGLPTLSPAQETGAAAGAEQIVLGRRIYREGILPSGQPLVGTGQSAGVVLSGAEAACVTCHRRSGYGSSEGPIEVRSITGSALFGERVAPPPPGSLGLNAPVVATPAHQLSRSDAAAAAHANAQTLAVARAAMFAGNRPRPAYDDSLLGRAIRQGIDVTGKVMNPAMPHYALDATALAALTAYLHTLSVETAPGVTEEAVHFATVLQPGTDAAQRRAVVDLLEVYFQDHNLGQRAEVRRERAGQVHLGRTYRAWTLHVWELQGSSDTWGKQLEALYRQQPVFAMVGGLGSASWRPIHEFSERFEVPCILPQADVPVVEGAGFYTVYLSQGMTLEAQALAKYLRDANERGPVVQVFRRDDASATAAAAFRKARVTVDSGLTDRVLDAPPDAAFWQRLMQDAPGATLVLWLRPEDLTQAQSLTAAGSSARAVYLSSGLVGDQRTGIEPDGAGRLRLIYPQELPSLRAARLEVVRRWLQSNGIALTDERVQFNGYLAATALGMMVAHSKDTFSREYLLERMEHRLGNSLEVSIYPHLSLGPGQRFASKGSYIVKIDGEGAGQLTPLSEWIVP